jgi:hypothetical protein
MACSILGVRATFEDSTILGFPWMCDTGFRERDLPIRPNWGRQDGGSEIVTAVAFLTALLHRGRHVLVFHQERCGSGIGGQLPGAGAVYDSGSASIRSFGLPCVDRFLDSTDVRRHGTLLTTFGGVLERVTPVP